MVVYQLSSHSGTHGPKIDLSIQQNVLHNQEDVQVAATLELEAVGLDFGTEVKELHASRVKEFRAYPMQLQWTAESNRYTTTGGITSTKASRVNMIFSNSLLATNAVAEDRAVWEIRLGWLDF